MLILLTLRGTPTIYYGDELGLENVPIPPGQGQDPFGLAHPDQGRDPVRTPMPWTAETGAGFTEGEPWLPIGGASTEKSVEGQRQDASSMLNLTRELLALRRRRARVVDWQLATGRDRGRGACLCARG